MLKDDRAVLFVHVPKAGGTTLERLFTDSGWTMRYRTTWRSNPEVFRLLRVSPQHYHGALLEELFKLDRFEHIFQVCRDPIHRFRSEFAMRNKTLTEADASTVEAWADEQFGLYATNPYLLDNHLRPQVDFLVPGVEVYRLEDGMKEIVDDLNGRYDMGLSTQIRHRLRSENHGLPSSAVEISDSLQAHLHEFYAADFERFGYPR